MKPCKLQCFFRFFPNGRPKKHCNLQCFARFGPRKTYFFHVLGSWRLLGLILGLLGSSWGPPWGPPGRLLGRFGGLLTALGGSWGALGGSWLALVLFLGPLWASLPGPGRVRDRFWTPPGPNEAKKYEHTRKYCSKSLLRKSFETAAAQMHRTADAQHHAGSVAGFGRSPVRSGH